MPLLLLIIPWGGYVGVINFRNWRQAGFHWTPKHKPRKCRNSSRPLRGGIFSPGVFSHRLYMSGTEHVFASFTRYSSLSQPGHYRIKNGLLHAVPYPLS